MNNTAMVSRAGVLHANGQHALAQKLLLQVLSSDPYFHSASYLLAKIKTDLGFYSEALDFCLSAITYDSNNARYLAQAAACCCGIRDYNSAQYYARRAFKVPDAPVSALYQIGTVFHFVGLFQYAVQAFESVVDREQRSASAYYSLGSSLVLCGRMQEAKKAYRKAIRLNPDYGQAYAALSDVRPADRRHNNISQLRRLISREKDPIRAINLYHGLARDYDFLGQYKQAYRALSKGKSKLLKMLSYDPDEEQRMFEVFLDLYERRNGSIGYKIPKPLFVVGMPRTGTTVVERILSNHEHVVSIGERMQFSELLKRICRSRSPRIVDAHALATSWKSIDFSALGKEYIESVEYLRQGASRFVDKLPLNVLLSGAIIHSLPNARVICLFRGALDTVISNFRQMFEYSTGTYFYSLDLDSLAKYVAAFRELAHSLQQQFPDNFFILDYEALVQNPMAKGQDLFEFCGLSWDDRYIQIYRNERPVGTASALQVKEPIHTNTINYWRKYDFCLGDVQRFFRTTGVNP